MREHFTEFEAAFGNDPFGGAASLAHRIREWIVERHDNLDSALFKHMRYGLFVESLALRGSQQIIWFYLSVKRCISWLKDESELENGELPEPAILAREAIGELEAAIAELRGILQELGEDISL